jgi:hypothetical protein
MPLASEWHCFSDQKVPYSCLPTSVAKASISSSFAAQKMPTVRKISFYKPKNYRYGGLIVDKKE